MAGIHDRDTSVLDLLNQRSRAAVDERPTVVHEHHFEDAQLQVARHLVHVTARETNVPDLTGLAQTYKRIDGTAGLRQPREVVKLRVVKIDQRQGRETDADLALANRLTYAVTGVVTALRIGLRRDHEVRRKSARTVDSQTDSLFTSSFRVSVRSVEKPDRAGKDRLHEVHCVVLRHLATEVLRHATERAPASTHRRDHKTSRA